jgi:hypothetical protein
MVSLDMRVGLIPWVTPIFDQGLAILLSEGSALEKHFGNILPFAFFLQGGPGDSEETAFRICAPTQAVRAAAEHWLMRGYLWRREEGMHATVEDDTGRMFSIHRYTDQDGAEKTVFFETTDSFCHEEEDFQQFLRDRDGDSFMGTYVSEVQAFDQLVRLAPNPELVRTLPKWLNENPEMKKQLSSIGDLKGHPQSDCAVDRYEMSRRFVNYAITCTERGDFMNARYSADFAKAFSTENMAALAITAEVYFRWKDRSAARYATVALAYKKPEVKGRLEEILAAPETVRYQLARRNRMNFIIRECARHPEWRELGYLVDSSAPTCCSCRWFQVPPTMPL